MTEAATEVCGLMRVDQAILGIDIRHLAEVTPVSSISPMMIEADGLLGALDLRGTLIPLLDPRRICGLPGDANAPAFAVVLRFQDRLLAIGIDELVGLAYPDREGLHDLFQGATPTGRAVAGAFLHEGAVVTVLAVETLFAQPGVPSVPAKRRPSRARSSGAGARRPVLTFSAGDACFAIEATTVHGTVPRRPIDRNSLTSGACLGSIQHHGRRIPVMDTTRVLGLGRHAERDAAEVVVLRFPDNKLLGFAVDSIQRMLAVEIDRLAPPPPGLGRAQDVLSRVFVAPDGLQIYVVGPEALQARADLVEMASLSGDRLEGDDVDAPAPTAAPAGSDGAAATPTAQADSAIVRERVRHLIFVAGRPIACPIAEVVRIVEPPKTVVPAPNGVFGLSGFFEIDGKALPLISLADVLGNGVDAPMHRVLIAGPADRRVGFAVSAVEGIETSTWRAADTAPAPVVEVGAKNARRILPLINLDTLSAELCG